MPDQAPLSELGPSELLAGLRRPDLSAAERKQLVIEAEALPFRGQERDELMGRLREFIRATRDSNRPDDLVAVGSAIRKLVANLDSGGLAVAAELLEAGHRACVPLEVELEVAKCVVRRLAAHPDEAAKGSPELEKCLADMAEAYVNDRLLGREKYGAVALNSLLALAVLRSGRLPEVVERLRHLRQRWFVELVIRRVRRTAEQVAMRNGDVAAELVKAMRQFEQQVVSEAM